MFAAKCLYSDRHKRQGARQCEAMRVSSEKWCVLSRSDACNCCVQLTRVLVYNNDKNDKEIAEIILKQQQNKKIVQMI